MGLHFLCGGLPRRQRDLRGCSYLDSVHHRADDSGRWAGWCLWGHIHTDRADHAPEDTESLRWIVRCRIRYFRCRWASHRLVRAELGQLPSAGDERETDTPTCFRWRIYFKSLVEMVLLL